MGNYIQNWVKVAVLYWVVLAFSCTERNRPPIVTNQDWNKKSPARLPHNSFVNAGAGNKSDADLAANDQSENAVSAVELENRRNNQKVRARTSTNLLRSVQNIAKPSEEDPQLKRLVKRIKDMEKKSEKIGEEMAEAEKENNKKKLEKDKYALYYKSDYEDKINEFKKEVQDLRAEGIGIKEIIKIYKEKAQVVTESQITAKTKVKTIETCEQKLTTLLEEQKNRQDVFSLKV